MIICRPTILYRTRHESNLAHCGIVALSHCGIVALWHSLFIHYFPAACPFRQRRGSEASRRRVSDAGAASFFSLVLGHSLFDILRFRRRQTPFAVETERSGSLRAGLRALEDARGPGVAIPC